MSRSSFSLFSVQRKQKKNASDFCFNFCSRHLSLSFVHSFISFFPFLSLSNSYHVPREKKWRRSKRSERGKKDYLLFSSHLSFLPRPRFPLSRGLIKNERKRKGEKNDESSRIGLQRRIFDHPRRMVSLCLQTQGGGKKTETHLCLFWKHGETDRGEGEGEDEKRYHHFSSTISRLRR